VAELEKLVKGGAEKVSAAELQTRVADRRRAYGYWLTVIPSETIGPDLVPLAEDVSDKFPLVGGIVLEIGGQLSHGAIVAREYGLPAVLGASGATERIADGQEIIVDGTEGRVTLLRQGGADEVVRG